MAAPHVAGAAALFTDFWRVRNNTTANPDPALVKAALINTTDDLGGRPDGNEGWGRINIDRMLNPTVPIEYFPNPDLLQASGEYWEIEVEAWDINEPLRVTLVWNDAPGATNANPALVNNLDLRLVDPTNELYRGNVFGTDGWSRPGFNPNTLDNVENVWIQNPINGTYTVRALGKTIAGDGQYYNGDSTDQPFSLVCYNCDVLTTGTHDAGADEVYAQVGRNGSTCFYATIADAIADASDGDTIYIPSGTYRERLGEVNKSLSFEAASDDCTQVNPNADSYSVGINADGIFSSFGGIIDISGSPTVTFTHMHLFGGDAEYGGIAYVSSGSTLILDDSIIGSGSATLFGGGIRSWGTVELLNASWLFNNDAVGIGLGGGIAIGGGTVNIRSGSRIGLTANPNESETSGGGVYMNGGILNLYDHSTIENNTAASNGGGVYASDGANIYMYDTTIIGDTSANGGNEAQNGAGVYLTGSGTSLNMYSGTEVSHNTATLHGGGIAVIEGASLSIAGGELDDNSAGAPGYGGGIYVDTNDVSTTVTIQDNALITGNSAFIGGGLYVADDNGTVTIENSGMDDNSAEFGGGIRLNGDSTVALNNARVRYNEATDGSGGGIALADGTYTAIDTNMRNNSSTAYGGGIFNTGGEVSLTSATRTSWINANTAANGGGIYDASGNTLSIEATNGQQFVMDDNTATEDGGAIYATNDTFFWPRGAFTARGNTAANGGFMYADNATAYIDDFGAVRPIITLNEATTGNGGGIYVSNSTDFALNGVELGTDNDGNTATAGSGGGIYIDNGAVRLITTRVQNNVAGSRGGGLYASNGSSVTVKTDFTNATTMRSTACDPTLLAADRYCSEFRGNDVGVGFGGAVYLSNAIFNAEYSAFLDNSAGIGSAIYSDSSSDDVILTSNLFANNATNIGSTVHLWIGKKLTANNNTFAANTGGAIGVDESDATVVINGNIAWGNTANSVINSAVSGACNNDQSGLLPGISADPLFINTPRGSYRLHTASPSLDACSTGPARDLDNTARAKDGNMNPSATEVDMGAFERDLNVVVTAVGLSSAETRISTPLSLSLVVMVVGLGLLTISTRRRMVRQSA